MPRGIEDNETYDQTYKNRIISPFARSGNADLGPGRFEPRASEPLVRPGAASRLVYPVGQEPGGARIISPFARSESADLGPGRFEPRASEPLVRTGSASSALMAPARSGLMEQDAGPSRPAGFEPRNLVGTSPIVSGQLMRRGAPGSGEYGARSDLNPVEFRRDTPMSVSEAQRKGLIVRGGAEERGPVFTRRDDLIIRGMREGRDRSMEMTGEAAKNFRARMDAGDTGLVRRSATGANPSSRKLAKMAAAGLRFDPQARGWVNVQGEEVGVRREVGLANADAELTDTIARSDTARRDREQRREEFGVNDANAKRRLDIDERNAGPKGLDRLDDADVAAGLSKYGKPKPLTGEELRKSDLGLFGKFEMEKDPARKAAMLERPWKDDDRRNYDNFRAEYERRGMGKKAEGGRMKDEGGATGGGGVKSKYARK